MHLFVLRRLLNFLLNSHLLIALGAFALCLQTQYLLTRRLVVGEFPIFVFFSTLALYALHRIVGLRQVRLQVILPGRYRQMQRYLPYYRINAIVGALTSVVLFFRLDWNLQAALFLPACLALGYALPVLPKGRRLRDMHYLKIFLLAICWSFITVLLAAWEKGSSLTLPIVLMLLERGCFIFAIALAFDIRDAPIDRALSVKTLPQLLSENGAKTLGIMLLTAMIGLSWINYRLNIYTLSDWLGLTFSVKITAILVALAHEQQPNFYFAGLLDGMLVLQFATILLHL